MGRKIIFLIIEIAYWSSYYSQRTMHRSFNVSWEIGTFGVGLMLCFNITSIVLLLLSCMSNETLDAISMFLSRYAHTENLLWQDVPLIFSVVFCILLLLLSRFINRGIYKKVGKYSVLKYVRSLRRNQNRGGLLFFGYLIGSLALLFVSMAIMDNKREKAKRGYTQEEYIEWLRQIKERPATHALPYEGKNDSINILEQKTSK